MAITKKEIDEIKSRLEKASSGPWRVATTTDGEYILDCDDCVVAAIFERKEDAYFVAHAREDITRLVAEVERLYNRNKELLEFNRMYFAQIKELRTEVERLRKDNSVLKAEVDRLTHFSKMFEWFLQEIDTHIRSTPEPLPYIITTMREFWRFMEGVTND